VSKRDEGRKSLDLPRRGAGGPDGTAGGRDAEEKAGRVHTLSGGRGERERERPNESAERRGAGWGRLKAGLLVGFNYICLYLHNKQQPRRSGCSVCAWCRF